MLRCTVRGVGTARHGIPTFVSLLFLPLFLSSDQSAIDSIVKIGNAAPADRRRQYTAGSKRDIGNIRENRRRGRRMLLLLRIERR